MKRLLKVERDTAHGESIYLYYSSAKVERTIDLNEAGSMTMDLDRRGRVVGIELIDPTNGDLELLIRVAKKQKLSLEGLFSFA